MRGESRGTGTLTVELPASIVKLLAKHADTLGISIDAPVYSTQLLGGLLGGQQQRVPGPERQQSGEPVRDDLRRMTASSCARRSGVKATDVGRGVGVAIIDSGIAPTPDLEGRISRVLRLHGRRRPGRDRAQ